MAKHYICRDSELPSGAQELAQELCGAGRGITPAWVEQCSAESEDFDGFVKQLRVGAPSRRTSESCVAPATSEKYEKPVGGVRVVWVSAGCWWVSGECGVSGFVLFGVGVELGLGLEAVGFAVRLGWLRDVAGDGWFCAVE